MFPTGQRLGAQAIGGAVVLITASALIWVGTAFAGYAIYLALIPATREPWAAAIAGGVLVIGPLAYALLLNARRPRGAKPRLHNPEPLPVSEDPESATLNLLAKVAQEKPLLAVVFAGILGASDAIAQRKNH
jgi:type VI protein secretion system component VasK